MTKKLKLRYSRVLRCAWGDEKFQRLSAPEPNAQTIWWRLLHGPEVGVVPGAIAAFAGGLADALHWRVEPFLERFAELTREGMAYADWKAGLVYLPNGISINSPDNPNMVKGWRATWAELPECPLKCEIYRGHELFLERLGKRYLEAFHYACGNPSRNRFGNPLGNQDQEQEQEIPPQSARANGVGAVPTQTDIPSPAVLAVAQALSEQPKLGCIPAPAPELARELVALLGESETDIRPNLLSKAVADAVAGLPTSPTELQARNELRMRFSYLPANLAKATRRSGSGAGGSARPEVQPAAVGQSFSDTPGRTDELGPDDPVEAVP